MTCPRCQQENRAGATASKVQNPSIPVEVPLPEILGLDNVPVRVDDLVSLHQSLFPVSELIARHPVRAAISTLPRSGSRRHDRISSDHGQGADGHGRRLTAVEAVA